MRFGPSVAVLAIILPFAAAPARASVCLGKSMSMEETIEVINASPGCDRAMKVFEACACGSSGDIHLGSGVERECERDFHAQVNRPLESLCHSKMLLCGC